MRIGSWSDSKTPNPNRRPDPQTDPVGQGESSEAEFLSLLFFRAPIVNRAIRNRIKRVETSGSLLPQRIQLIFNMMFPCRPLSLATVLAVCLCTGQWALAPDVASGTDHYLTIGGGYARSGNQASLEKNVLYFQRVLRKQAMESGRHAIFFADGLQSDADLQVIDRESVPKANRLMAEFFGDTDDLGLSYRNHEIPDVRGSTRPANIRAWFSNEGRQMKSGDRLILYVTAHGNRSSDRGNPYNTEIATWGNGEIKMKELAEWLDQLDSGVQVVAIMVQCHAGGFARFIFRDGDPDKDLAVQRRVGFFATVHDRSAAGCTPEIDEANYVEYSTYFWAALSGLDRSGTAIKPPDYDGDGQVSFEEAHAYVILSADTIDLPIKTSGEYLSVHSKFAEGDSNLLTNEEPYDDVLALATPVQRAILEGLSEQLDLDGSDRLSQAYEAIKPRRRGSRGRGRRPISTEDRLRMRIRNDLSERWPELANVLNPRAIDLVTSRQDEFVAAVEGHPDYQRYRELKQRAEATPDDQKRRVKYDRFLRVADNVILAENLRRMNDEEKLREFEALVQAERGSL